MAYVVLCGTPDNECSGGNMRTSNSYRGLRKAHGSHTEAFNCYKKYLLKQGYEQIGSREFRPPDGGPIRVLTKKSRFGGKMRKGKLGERWMPKDHTSGLIISH